MKISDSNLRERRERVFLVFAGFFLGSLAMLNIIGISRFVDLSFEIFGLRIPFVLAVGVLPYPITFLCTDFISELFGRRRANFMVWVGLILNLWVIFILWLGGVLPGYEEVNPQTGQIVRDAAGRLPVFFEIRALTFGAVAASMLAYLSAQFCDVYLFHFWKDLTKGKHLWLRNNGSTLVSQFIDTFAVITITHFYARALPVDEQAAIWPQLWVFIGSGYVFKLVSALLDTVPFYLGVRWLSAYLEIPAPLSQGESR
ncbi:MAG TPA: queuosine precursor transporter [Acidobacteriota bacterium]|nr:queuosine precursor transporter [Acidobacteriota bacterium]